MDKIETELTGGSFGVKWHVPALELLKSANQLDLKQTEFFQEMNVASLQLGGICDTTPHFAHAMQDKWGIARVYNRDRGEVSDLCKVIIIIIQNDMFSNSRPGLNSVYLILVQNISAFEGARGLQTYTHLLS